MNNDLNQKNDLLFSEDRVPEAPKDKWKVLIVDDDEDIHDVTKFVLKDFEFRGKKLLFISAFTIAEAQKIVNDNADLALILLDVVMEEEDSGLKFVKYLREDLNNKIVRIILRTGQPGVAPQNKVVVDYDINDYKEKTELTKEKLSYSVVMALRSFEILKSFQLSVNFFETSLLSADRFISKNYLAILDKESINDINVGDYTEREMTTLYIDMGTLFYNLNHSTSKEKLQLVNRYVNILDQIIRNNNGFIHFFSDTILALFDKPTNNAIHAGIDLIQTLTASSKQKLDIQIGMQTGLLTLGVIGNEDKIHYVTLGETIHLTTLLLEKNKYYNTRILVGETTIQNLTHPESFHFRWVGNLVDYHKKQCSIYEVFDIDEESIKEKKQQTKDLFESAVKNYIERNFDESKKKFTDVLNLNPQDKIAKKYLEILADLSHQPA